MKKILIFSVIITIFSGCGGGDDESSNPVSVEKPKVIDNSITQNEFSNDTIEKELPNGEKFTINNIQEVIDIPLDSNQKVYTTKIDDESDGFFVVNGDSIEGTFSRDGKKYSIGTFKDGQKIVELQDIKDKSDVVIPPIDNSKLVKISDNILSRNKTTKPNMSILFIYNDRFGEWCDRDKSIVDNKLSASIAYTNTAFSNSKVNASVSIAGSHKLTLSSDSDTKDKTLEELRVEVSNSSSQISKLRDEYKADIVFLLKYTNRANGGIAYYSIYQYSENYIQKSPEYAIGVQDVYYGINDSILAHELGHIFGCAHDDKIRLEQINTLKKDYNKYANGYWLKDLHYENSYYSTLMGYGDDIQNYSNPNIYYEGVATGISGDSESASDCARFINFSAPFIADFKTDEPIEEINEVPIANAGGDILVNEGTSVTLEGFNSYDSDGSISKYEWTQTSGISVTLSGENSSTPNFTAPNVQSDSVLEFKITVTDNDDATSSDSIRVTIKNIEEVTNKLPIANAGGDIIAYENESVTLNATNSDGSIVSYEWSIASGKSPDILSNSSSFTKSDFSIGSHSITLRVRDDKGATSSDIVVVTIKQKEVVLKDVELRLGGRLYRDEQDTTIIPINESDEDNRIDIIECSSNPSTIDFSNSKAKITLNTPKYSDIQEFSIECIAYDNSKVELDRDTVEIIINQPKVITPLVANAGVDVNVKENQSVAFDASGSSGDIINYEWREDSRLLSNQVSFTKNDFFVGTHNITLSITDKNGLSSKDDINIDILPDLDDIKPSQNDLSLDSKAANIIYNIIDDKNSNKFLIKWKSVNNANIESKMYYSYTGEGHWIEWNKFYIDNDSNYIVIDLDDADKHNKIYITVRFGGYDIDLNKYESNYSKVQNLFY